MRDSVHLAKWTLTGLVLAERRRRRKWSEEEKREICAQTRLSGVSVSQVARRYNVNANQVFNWLKDPRYVTDDGAVEEAQFLSVEIVEQAPVPSPPPAESEGVIELDLADGHRVRISGLYDPEALARLLRGLSG